MSKKGKKVKVIKSTAPAVAKAPVNVAKAKAQEDTFFLTKTNYMIMGVGVILIALGLGLMVGGHMPNEDIWDDNIIYSTRITVIAPLLILLGLGVQVVAIFKK